MYAWGTIFDTPYTFKSVSEFNSNVNRGGIIAIALNDGDNLVGVISTSGTDHVLLATKEGMAIRFDEDDARVMGRDTAGVKGIELAESDEVVGIVRCDDVRALLTVTSNGFGKRTAFGEYLVQSEDGSTRAQSRGGKGRIDIQTTDKNGVILVGGEDHRTRLQSGTCWVAGCHEAVHGSHVSKPLRY